MVDGVNEVEWNNLDDNHLNYPHIHTHSRIRVGFSICGFAALCYLFRRGHSRSRLMPCLRSSGLKFFFAKRTTPPWGTDLESRLVIAVEELADDGISPAE